LLITNFWILGNTFCFCSHLILDSLRVFVNGFYGILSVSPEPMHAS
jgi:hypothetical protein